MIKEYNIAAGVMAFSTTRKGGVSQGNYGEFNINEYCGDFAEHVAENRKILKGDFLDHYEFSFQLSGLSDCKMSGSYPVYVDKDNYVKAQFNGITRMLE